MSTKVEIDGNGNIVIQKVEGSTITINPSVPEEVRNALINYQSLMADLPNQIIQLLMKNNSPEPPKIGANVYLGLNFLISSFVTGVSLSVQITNLTNEIRFFNRPFFKVSTPFEEGADTFVMTNVIGNQITFPKKMEYGEVISEAYQLVPNNIQMFQQLLETDPEATITAYVSTTLGEVYSSEPYPVKEIVNQGHYVR